jgi:PAS domain S-box-containing protein
LLQMDQLDYESFFDISIDLLCVAGYDGYFKRLNSAWRQTLGFTEAELMARPYLDFVHPDDRPATLAEAVKLTQGAKVIHFRNRYQCSDGSYRWLAWSAMPTASDELIYAMARDVTPEVQLENGLRVANLAAAARLAMLTALIDAIGVGVILINRDGLVAHWNRESSRLTGIAADKALGLTVAQLGQAMGRHAEENSTLQVDLEKASRSVTEARFQVALNEPRREIEVSVTPAVSTSEGGQVGLVMVLHDITAARELDRAKDELIAMVSHELRTPLASLVGFAELLLSREFAEAQRKKYLETMLNEGRRLTDLINEFLDLQRLEGGYASLNLGPVDLESLIGRAVDSAGDNPQTPIEVNLRRDLPLVVADANAIHQVLINLLSNARKYSPGGGSILVEAKASGEMVEVSVRDHGLGIPADAMPKLFSKFYRVANTDRRRISGTGLGLAISRRIVEIHGGRVGAESDGLGQGSRFYFTLRAAELATGSGDVLIVEDDRGFATLLEAELEAMGISSVWAVDAETADRMIDRVSVRAVVLDLVLPGVSGQDFLARLRAVHKSSVPVVVVTIQELDATTTLALRTAGVVAILKKHSGAARDAAIFVADELRSLSGRQ